MYQQSTCNQNNLIHIQSGESNTSATEPVISTSIEISESYLTDDNDSETDIPTTFTGSTPPKQDPQSEGFQLLVLRYTNPTLSQNSQLPKTCNSTHISPLSSPGRTSYKRKNEGTNSPCHIFGKYSISEILKAATNTSSDEHLFDDDSTAACCGSDVHSISNDDSDLMSLISDTEFSPIANKSKYDDDVYIVENQTHSSEIQPIYIDSDGAISPITTSDKKNLEKDNAITHISKHLRTPKRSYTHQQTSAAQGSATQNIDPLPSSLAIQYGQIIPMSALDSSDSDDDCNITSLSALQLTNHYHFTHAELSEQLIASNKVLKARLKNPTQPIRPLAPTKKLHKKIKKEKTDDLKSNALKQGHGHRCVYHGKRRAKKKHVKQVLNEGAQESSMEAQLQQCAQKTCDITRRIDKHITSRGPRCSHKFVMLPTGHLSLDEKEWSAAANNTDLFKHHGEHTSVVYPQERFASMRAKFNSVNIYLPHHPEISSSMAKGGFLKEAAAKLFEISNTKKYQLTNKAVIAQHILVDATQYMESCFMGSDANNRLGIYCIGHIKPHGSILPLYHGNHKYITGIHGRLLGVVLSICELCQTNDKGIKNIILRENQINHGSRLYFRRICNSEQEFISRGILKKAPTQ